MAVRTQIVFGVKAEVVAPWEMALVILGVLLLAGDAAGRFGKKEK